MAELLFGNALMCQGCMEPHVWLERYLGTKPKPEDPWLKEIKEGMPEELLAHPKVTEEQLKKLFYGDVEKYKDLCCSYANVKKLLDAGASFKQLTLLSRSQIIILVKCYSKLSCELLHQGAKFDSLAANYHHPQLLYKYTKEFNKLKELKVSLDQVFSIDNETLEAILNNVASVKGRLDYGETFEEISLSPTLYPSRSRVTAKLINPSKELTTAQRSKVESCKEKETYSTSTSDPSLLTSFWSTTSSLQLSSESDDGSGNDSELYGDYDNDSSLYTDSSSSEEVAQQKTVNTAEALEKSPPFVVPLSHGVMAYSDIFSNAPYSFPSDKSEKINIRGLDKAEVLCALYQNAKTSSWTEKTILNVNIGITDKFVLEVKDLAEHWTNRITEKLTKCNLSLNEARKIILSNDGQEIDYIGPICIQINFSDEFINVTQYNKAHVVSHRKNPPLFIKGSNPKFAEQVIENLKMQKTTPEEDSSICQTM